MEKKSKKTYWKILKKKLKLRHILLLIILFSSNSFAWFIYSRQVQADMTVHVRSWKIVFESGDNPITSYVDINVDNVSPGMTDFTKDLSAYNKSDVSAKLQYTILNANIMGTEIKTKEGKIDAKETLVGDELTSAQLESQLATNYPFKITMALSTQQMDAEYGEAKYSVFVKWPYESGDDATDTLWGNNAYDFKQANPDKSCITLKIKLDISQAN